MERQPSEQLLLPIRARVRLQFQNYFSAANAAAVEALIKLVDTLRDDGTSSQCESCAVMLHGATGTGKTHLLFSSLNLAEQSNLGSACQYLDCNSLPSSGADQAAMLSNLGHAKLILLDNVEAVAGTLELERALFSLIDQSRQLGHYYVCASRPSVDQCGFVLNDLSSRLNAGLRFNLMQANDQEIKRAIAERFRAMGVGVEANVVQYLITRFSRDNHDLFAALDTLDLRSFQHNRPITIPFLREQLNLVAD